MKTIEGNKSEMVKSSNLMKQGVKFTTSCSRLEQYKVSEKNLLPGVIVTDSSS